MKRFLNIVLMFSLFFGAAKLHGMNNLIHDAGISQPKKEVISLAKKYDFINAMLGKTLMTLGTIGSATAVTQSLTRRKRICWPILLSSWLIGSFGYSFDRGSAGDILRVKQRQRLQKVQKNIINKSKK